MIRAQFKDERYFEKYIAYQKDRILKFLNILNSLEKTNEYKIVQCKAYILEFYKNLLSAEYSAGMHKEEIKGTFKEYLFYLNDVPISNYTDLIDTLSFAVLFDCEENDLENVLKETKFDDAIILKMKEYIRLGKIQNRETELKCKVHYQAFDEYLNDEISLNEFLKYMENNWYNSCSEFAFFDTHKSSEDVYTGYWCWLAAAILKMKEITEVASKYIPADLI